MELTSEKVGDLIDKAKRGIAEAEKEFLVYETSTKGGCAVKQYIEDPSDDTMHDELIPIRWYTGVVYCFHRVGDGTVVGGISVTSKKDTFSKTLGRTIARGRMSKSLHSLVDGTRDHISTRERGLTMLDLCIEKGRVRLATDEPTHPHKHTPVTRVYVPVKDIKLWGKALAHGRQCK